MQVPCHTDVRPVGRSTGGNTVAMGAYRHGVSMVDEATGLSKNYSAKRDEVVAEGLVLPKDAPQWAIDRYGGGDVAAASERLWNDIEARESQHRKRDVSQLALSFTLALPNMLSHEQQAELVRDYIEKALVVDGQVADWVIHDTGKGSPHAHIMTTLRTLGEDGHDQRIRTYQNRRMMVLNFRFTWAEVANEHLARAGFGVRMDHRTYEAQGIRLEPYSYSPHLEKSVEASGKAYRVKQRVLAARKGNEEFLREHPDHILTVVAAGSPEFTREQVEEAFLKFLPPSFGKAQVAELMRAAMASDELVATGEKDYRAQPKYTSRVN